MADSAFDRFAAKLPADYFRSESEKDIARVAFAAGVTVGALGVVADTLRTRDSRAGGEAASGPDLSASARPTFAMPKWEQRVRPNGDVIAILAVAEFRALVQRLHDAEAMLPTRKVYRDQIFAAQTLIAQLDRVRTAALDFRAETDVEAIGSGYPSVDTARELDAALAAVSLINVVGNSDEEGK